MKSKTLLTVLAVILLALAAGLAWRRAAYLPEITERQEAQEQYENLAETVIQTPGKEPEAEMSAEAPSSHSGAQEASGSTLVDFDSLTALNPDTVAWISIPGAGINYPVVQAADNNAYLRRSFTGEQSIAGTIFLDFANSSDFSDGNSVIHGHNMFDGSANMFSSRPRYTDIAFWKDNPDIHRVTTDGEVVYRICAVCRFDISSGTAAADYYRQDFRSEEHQMEYIQNLINQSLIQTNETVPTGSKLLTLSTCERKVYGDNGRLIVVGYLAK